MGIEIWFRGEGAGVAPAKAGGHLHDLGDGMYLTDSESVAEIYANRRATTPEDELAWMAAMERQSLGRVLDLTADSRWSTFMTAADKPKLLGKSRLDYLKIKQELYGQFFEEFLALNKINIKSYDAVIGPEYNLGGNQLCILHQNGQPSKLSVRIRALLRRATPVARWSSTSANPVSPKPGIPVEVEPPPIIPKLTFRAGLKFVGGILVGVLVALMIAVLDSWLTKKLNVRIIENEMKRLEPKIKLRVAKHKRQILDQLSAGRPTFIIVTVDVSYSRDVDPDAGPTNSPPSVDLVSVIISERKLEGAGDSWMDKQVMSTLNHEEYHFSIEATAAKVDLDSYRDTIKQLDWYETALKDPNLTSDDVARLTKEKQALEEFFRKLLDS